MSLVFLDVVISGWQTPDACAEYRSDLVFFTRCHFEMVETTYFVEPSS